jgi:flagellar biosynthesis GTPase FlhF
LKDRDAAKILYEEKSKEVEKFIANPPRDPVKLPNSREQLKNALESFHTNTEAATKIYKYLMDHKKYIVLNIINPTTLLLDSMSDSLKVAAALFGELEHQNNQKQMEEEKKQQQEQEEFEKQQDLQRQREFYQQEAQRQQMVHQQQQQKQMELQRQESQMNFQRQQEMQRQMEMQRQEQEIQRQEQLQREEEEFQKIQREKEIQKSSPAPSEVPPQYATEWFYIEATKQAGPVSFLELKKLYHEKVINSSTFVFGGGLKNFIFFLIQKGLTTWTKLATNLKLLSTLKSD